MVYNSRVLDEDETNNNETTWNKGTTCGITNVYAVHCVFLGLSHSTGVVNHADLAMAGSQEWCHLFFPFSVY